MSRHHIGHAAVITDTNRVDGELPLSFEKGIIRDLMAVIEDVVLSAFRKKAMVAGAVNVSSSRKDRAVGAFGEGSKGRIRGSVANLITSR